MKVNYYLTVEKTKDPIESKYFWYYQDGYTCVDARYLNINVSNAYALFEMESFFYKLIYLNDNITEGILVDEGLKMLNKYKKYKGVFISEQDIFYIANKCFNSDFSNSIVERIYTNKKFLWKSCVDELYVMSDDEKKEYEYLSGIKKDIYLSGFKLKKKRKEVITFLNKSKGMDKKKKIIEVIEFLNINKKGDECISISDIVNETNFSFKTVKKYYEEYINNDIKIDGYKTIINRNEINKQEKINEIQSIINQMKLNKEEINKKSVSDKSGVSRTTITKHWDKLIK
jgi:hypothetical protein